jgi:hypothetical protein
MFYGETTDHHVQWNKSDSDTYHIFSHMQNLDWKEHESGRGTIWEAEADHQEWGGEKETVLSGEDNQSILCACIKIL